MVLKIFTFQFLELMSKIIYLLLILFAFNTCKKDPALTGDYFAFGVAHGFCINNCADFFLIKKNKLYPDDMEHFWGKLTFKNTPLPAQKYESANNLKINFPVYLRQHPDTTFGCPDCVDQGRIYIEIKEKGDIMFWNIDPSKNTQPTEIQNYIENMEEVLEVLKK